MIEHRYTYPRVIPVLPQARPKSARDAPTRRPGRVLIGNDDSLVERPQLSARAR
jgi:hypothetical protein